MTNSSGWIFLQLVLMKYVHINKLSEKPFLFLLEPGWEVIFFLSALDQLCQHGCVSELFVASVSRLVSDRCAV